MKRVSKGMIGILWLSLIQSHSHACIWQDGDQPFWPSNEIEVCFLSQDQEHSAIPELALAYKNARESIERVLNQQINARNTGFKLYGFKSCTYDYRKQGPRADLPPMIRIELSADGKLVGQSAMTNGLIGPLNGSKSVNTTISYASRQARIVNGKKDGTKFWKSQVSPRFEEIVLHEILHIFGIHHAYYWDDEAELQEATGGRYVKLGESMDGQSMMCNVQGCDPNSNGPVLSQGDIRCLQAIANRSIRDLRTEKKRRTTPASGLN